MFVWVRYKSLYIYINTEIKTTTASPQGYPFLSTNVDVSPVYGLIVASIKQFWKIKQNNFT